MDTYRHRQRAARIKTRKLHAKRLEPKGGFANNSGEAEIVPGYQLANVLRAWIHLRELEYPEPEVYGFTGPVKFIAEHTDLDERQVRAYITKEYEIVSLSVADRILFAIGREHLLSTEIQVLPNPNWSLEKWMGYMNERGFCDYDLEESE